jgi:hypothetical protein
MKHVTHVMVLFTMSLLVNTTGMASESLSTRFEKTIAETIDIMNRDLLEKSLYHMTVNQPDDIVLPVLDTNAPPLKAAFTMRLNSCDYYETLACIGFTLGKEDISNEALDNLQRLFNQMHNRDKPQRFEQMMRLLQFYINHKQIDRANALVESINASISKLDLLYSMASILQQTRDMGSSFNNTIDRIIKLSKTFDDHIYLAERLYQWEMTEHALIVMKSALDLIRDSDQFERFVSLAHRYNDRDSFDQGLDAWQKWCSRYESYNMLLAFMESKNVPGEKQKSVIRSMYKLARSFDQLDGLIKKCVLLNWDDLAIEIMEFTILEALDKPGRYDYRNVNDPYFLFSRDELPVIGPIDIFIYSGTLNERLGQNEFAYDAYRAGLIEDGKEYLSNAGFLLTGNLNAFFYFYNFAAKRNDAASLKYMKQLDPWVSAIENVHLERLQYLKTTKQSELAELTGMDVTPGQEQIKPPRFLPGHLLRLVQAVIVCILSWLVFLLCDRRVVKISNGKA